MKRSVPQAGENPFDPAYEYNSSVEAGLDYIFSTALTIPIGVQPAGNPDTDGDGIGIYFPDPDPGPTLYSNETYDTGIVMMAIAGSRAPDMVVTVGPLAGWTYGDVLQDAVDYLAFGQCDAPSAAQGGWYYTHNLDWADNSNTGYAVLGLAFAESPQFGFGSIVPAFVKTELDLWIGAMQDPVDGDQRDGGSWYQIGWDWVNLFKTGNLVHQMAFFGNAVGDPRVMDALDYIERHWNDGDQDPGWKDSLVSSVSNYQPAFTLMKGLESLAIELIDLDGTGGPEFDWFDDMSTELVAEQHPDGAWRGGMWGDDILNTTWALLALERIVPVAVVDVPFDVMPKSCQNPFSVGKKGVLPAAILGTEDLDVTQIDPASILIGPEDGEVVPPIRWDLEDVATPYNGDPPDGTNAYACTEEGPDGFMDLTLKFDAQAVAAALGPVNDGDIILLLVVGELMDGTPIKGVDVIAILKKGKKAPAVSSLTAALDAYPIPFNPEVWMPYRLGEGVEVKVTIYSASGHFIRALDLGYRPTGEYASRGKAAYWDGKNEVGELVSSGIYFYTFQASTLR